MPTNLRFHTPLDFEAALDASGVGAPVTMFMADRGPFEVRFSVAALGPVTATGGHASRAAIVRVDELAQPCISFRVGEWKAEAPLRSGVQAGAVMLRVPGMEHFFAHGGGGAWAVLLLEPEALQRRAEALTGARFDLSASLPRLFKPKQADFDTLAGLHASVMADAAPGAAEPRAEPILDAVVRCLAAAEEDGATRRRHLEMLLRMRAVIEEHPERPLQINDLCALMNVSCRTLHAVSVEHFGMGPKRYLTLRRLDMARRALRAAPDGANVTAIALRCGFWELGRFAGAYKLAFGESPSETLRRAP